MGQFHRWNKHCKLCGVEFASYRSDTEFCSSGHGKEYRYLKKSHPEVIQQLAGNSPDEDMIVAQIEEKPLFEAKREYPPTGAKKIYQGKSFEGFFRKKKCSKEWKDTLRMVGKNGKAFAALEIEDRIAKPGQPFFLEESLGFFLPNNKMPFQIWTRVTKKFKE